METLALTQRLCRTKVSFCAFRLLAVDCPTLFAQEGSGGRMTEE
jgi:hypothetical protein